MKLDATARRRWFGGLVLLGALAMLVCGETVLKGRLQPVAFLVYWLVCVLLTGLALVAAIRDLRHVQYRIRQEQRELLESTLKQIEAEAGGKRPNSQSNN